MPTRRRWRRRWWPKWLAKSTPDWKITCHGRTPCAANTLVCSSNHPDAAGSGVGRAVARLPVIVHTIANVPHLLAQPEIEGVVARNSSGLIEAKACGRWSENLAPFLCDFHRERPRGWRARHSRRASTGLDRARFLACPAFAAKRSAQRPSAGRAHADTQPPAPFHERRLGLWIH